MKKVQSNIQPLSGLSMNELVKLYQHDIMMTPKQQAKKLMKQFYPYAHGMMNTPQLRENSIKCALVCVKELLKIKKLNGVRRFTNGYWLAVKEELLNLK